MKKLLSKIFAVVLSIFMLVPAYADTNKRVDRIAGGNREETSVKISKESFDSSEYAILATEGDYQILCQVVSWLLRFRHLYY